MKYKITNSNIFKNLSFSFFLIILGIIFWILSIKIQNFIDIRIMIFLIIIPLIIVILLLIDYLKNSTKGNITITSDGIDIILRNEVRHISKVEIIKVIVYGAPSVKRKSKFRLLPFEAFHYIELRCQNGEAIIISSLSDYNLYWNIAKESILKNKLYFNKGGLSGQGNLINSITWNKMN